MGKKMAVSTEQRFVFLGSQKGLFKEAVPSDISICHDRAEVEAAVIGIAKTQTWISFNRTFTDILLKEVIDRRADLHGSHLITLIPPRSESIPALVGLFHPVFGLVDGFQWLPKEELVEVITRDDASDRFIGGSVDLKAKTLTLLRGDITAVVAPFSLFPKSGDGTAADFTRVGFTDYGRTVALGDYETSADAILYELDPGYRRKLNKQRRQSERSFGASLMRLRKQRRLKRGDFAPISSKEIARLERNEVSSPHAKTLETIAKRLEVRPEEIKGY
jgi:DNA-binding Xre family transcriptional regulator